MKKLTAHHLLTPKGGRVAARTKAHAFKTVAHIKTLWQGPMPFAVMMGPRRLFVLVTGQENIGRTRQKGAGA
jgi:hypothetical protein